MKDKIFLIDGNDLQKSKYSNIRVISYVPKEENPENKCIITLSLETWKILEADDEKNLQEKIKKLIRGE